jgi:predicted  nucleic acid-binding Zn-ribbon protein
MKNPAKLRSTSLLVTSQPTSQQLADYANALIAVNSYAYAITNQQLPVLNSPPPDYAEFANFFAPAKQHALDWSTDIFVSMVQLPVTIVNQAANLFSTEDTLITEYLKQLVSNPNDAGALQGLQSALSTTQKLIKNQLATVSTINIQLEQFLSNIQQDASTLNSIASAALADAGNDKAAIEQLKADIVSMNQQIATYQTVLTVSEIGIPLSIFIGLIGGVVCTIPGAQGIGAGLIIAGVAGTGASIAGTVIASKNIQALQGAITTEKDQISSLNQDVIQLQAISTQFDALLEASLQAQNALTTIENMWNEMDSVITSVGAELDYVENDVTSEDYQQALTDFGQAADAWSDVVDFAQGLASISYSWQDASGNWHQYGTENPGSNNGNVNQIQAA